VEKAKQHNVQTWVSQTKLQGIHGGQHASKLECCYNCLWFLGCECQDRWQTAYMFVLLDSITSHAYQEINQIWVPRSTQSHMLQVKKCHILTRGGHSICANSLLVRFSFGTVWNWNSRAWQLA